MIATISWWDLSKSDQSIDSLRKYLERDGIAPWCAIKGLLLKFWISDSKTNRWGAVMIWQSAEFIKQPMPSNRALELIGYPPSERVMMDVESVVGDWISQDFLSTDLISEIS